MTARFRTVEYTRRARGKVVVYAKTPVFLHPCSVCGSDNAPFGKGVSLKKNKLGTWYCSDCLPEDYYERR